LFTHFQKEVLFLRESKRGMIMEIGWRFVSPGGMVNYSFFSLKLKML
jgi:hypothetical protein